MNVPLDPPASQKLIGVRGGRAKPRHQGQNRKGGKGKSLSSDEG